MESVSWDDAVEFCRRLSERSEEKAAKRRYQLPTEAQWEYACRAGNPGRRYFSDQRYPVPRAVEEKSLGDYTWFDTNSNGQTHPVGQKLPNAWGLYDMYGNVSEWCQDWYEIGLLHKVAKRRSYWPDRRFQASDSRPRLWQRIASLSISVPLPNVAWGAEQ